MDIKAAIENLAVVLQSAGLKASSDNQKLNPPCAWIHPGPINASTLDGAFTMTAQVTLITPKTTPLNDLDKLSGMLVQLLTVLEPDGAIDTDTSAQIAQKLHPAFVVPVNIDI